MINKNRKKEWIPEADYLTLACCNILIPEAKILIIFFIFIVICSNTINVKTN